MILGAFAVEQTHGVFLQTRKAGRAKLILVLAEVVAQRLIVLGATFGAADGIELETDIGKTQPVEHRLRHADHFGVGYRRLCAVFLDTELVELSESARLRLFVTVAGHEVARLYGQALVFERVLQNGARGARGAFGAQGYALAALCVKGVHFLLHHVGGLTHSARKKLGVLEHGGAYLLKAVGAAFLAHYIFNELPAVALLGQHILGSLYLFRN